ncbi:hypothetical protein Desca_0629 [Desulfotomaculum nigrificans CO-1-SRB]|uniref:Transposase IS3/IS911 family protein n=1 Tax=Desulfotomaculum nigrificans (strain DSM 14880 / VKM B-2319 / CO-1-SRB) TaxID=868595 RepID=F6B872_DESCC|nr:hypothetical protein [Desulfotomaculum nigrificans]AEF93517.1 hypothetical protein Desca_0629 [Desulfotomaculum nigrificans CO-1-SRB]
MIKQNLHRKTYRKEFKLQTIKMIIEQGNGYRGVASELGLPYHKMVRN